MRMGVIMSLASLVVLIQAVMRAGPASRSWIVMR